MDIILMIHDQAEACFYRRLRPLLPKYGEWQGHHHQMNKGRNRILTPGEHADISRRIFKDIFALLKPFPYLTILFRKHSSQRHSRTLRSSSASTPVKDIPGADAPPYVCTPPIAIVTVHKFL